MHYIAITIVFLLSQVFVFQDIADNSQLMQENKIEDSFTPEQLEAANKLILGSEEEAAMMDATQIYKANCSSCHGRKGGLGISGAANLKKSTMPLEERVAMIYFGKDKMLPYSESLTNIEIVALAQYVETLRKS